MDTHFDLVAIGGGSAGLAVARRAAKLGAKCAIVESAALGGTCVNAGCVPKKIMWYAAEIGATLKRAADYGWTPPKAALNWQLLKDKRDTYVRRLNDIYADALTKAGIPLIPGHAQFIDAHTVRVGEQTINGDHIVIATGGQANVPQIPGAMHGITSDGFFQLTDQPKNVAIVGAGYIAVELAGIFHALGSKVTLFMRGQLPLERFDRTISEALLEEMRRGGIEIVQSTDVGEIEKDGSSNLLAVRTIASKRFADFDCLLWATGRAPSTASLGLANIGLDVDSGGHIVTDGLHRTSVANIYAIGDVTGRVALTPVAIAAGRHLAEHLFGSRSTHPFDFTNIPTVVFSHPPIGTIGLTEEQARSAYGGDVRVFQTAFRPMYYAFSPDGPRSHLKLITVGKDEKIVGCHIIGLGSDEILQGFAVAIKMGATKRDLNRTMAIHPTAAEELVTMS